MAQRCEHCKHWIDTVFKGQSASGWGVWYGNCLNPAVEMPPIGMDRHSLMLACRWFEAGTHPKSLNAMTSNAKAVGLDAAGGQSHTSDGLCPGADNGEKTCE